MKPDQVRATQNAPAVADAAQVASGDCSEAGAHGSAPGSGSKPKGHTQPRMTIREVPPKARGLPSRKILLSGATMLGGLVAFALVTGLSPRARSHDEQARKGFRPAIAPESVRNGPLDYADVGTAEFGDGSGLVTSLDLTPPPDPKFSEGSVSAGGVSEGGGSDLGVSGRGMPPEGAYGGNGPFDPAIRPRPPRLDESAAAESDAAARASPITFGGGAGAPDRGTYKDTYADKGNARDEMTSPSRLTAPASAYVLQAGSVIPAALRTALNSEAPGRVIAQVIAPVYDSLTGEHLLVPQGARLLGTYQSGARYGERRIRIVWNRLILPNGFAINLHDMAAVDQAGSSGLGARVDDHIGRVAAASVISGALSTAANAAQDRESSVFAQSVGDAAAQEATRVGGRIVDRELDVRPTLSVPVGARIKVLIEQDIVFRQAFHSSG